MSTNESKSRRQRYDLSLPSADYPSWLGPPRQTLAICTHYRCGSTLLGEAIYFAHGLGCPLEYFAAGFMRDFRDTWRSADIRSYVRDLHRHRTDMTGVFSIKLFWWDVVEFACEMAPDEFEGLHRISATKMPPAIYRRLFALLSEVLPNPTIVFLGRHDQIRQAVSHALAGQTREWRRYSAVKSAAARYSFDDLFRCLTRIRESHAHWQNFFAANALICHEIFYEDLAQDYDKTVRDLFVRLGRPNAPIIAPRLRKQADAHTEEFVQRFLVDFHRRARG